MQPQEMSTRSANAESIPGPSGKKSSSSMEIGGVGDDDIAGNGGKSEGRAVT